MNETAWKEKRVFRRIPAAAVLEVFLIEDASGIMANAPRRKAESLNISAGGVLLSTDIRLPVGTRVGLKLDLDSIYSMNADWQPGEGHEPAQAIEAVGKVVRVKGADEIGYEIALAFDELTGKNAKVLRDLLES